MKNIHLIATDKPSRIFIDIDDNKLKITKPLGGEYMMNQHIYITNSEEIKEGDWFVHSSHGITNIYKAKSVVPESIITTCDNGCWVQYCKKIILSTNQDLIKDGVQAIPDEFLEYFIKNPSCEFIEVTRSKKLSSISIWDAKEGDLVFNNHGIGGIIQELSDDVRVHILPENGEVYMEVATTSDNGKDTLIICGYKVYEYTDYKIIIPKEEPKQEFPQLGTKEFNNLASAYFGGIPQEEPNYNMKQEILDEMKRLEDPKQETTLEEAAEKESQDFKVWDELFGILAWKFKPTKNGDMFLDAKKVFEELKSKFKLEKL
jgi:hypothetical protein